MKNDSIIIPNIEKLLVFKDPIF